MDDPNITSRKTDHIRINLEKDVLSGLTTGLEKYHFIHQALPEMDLEDVQLGQDIFGREVKIPILISSMTGGTHETGVINRRLAEAAQATGAAMGLGSMRAALVDEDAKHSFMVRDIAPDIFLMANLGAVQLNYGFTVDHCQMIVEMVGADALVLHLNPVQEALQPEGDTRFANLLIKIEHVCKALSVPVVVKEVGWGISEKTARYLADAGVAAIDVAGAGGTSWSQVEMHRINAPRKVEVAAAFRKWGIPTAESIQMARSGAPGLPIFASGGLNNGIDIAKCIALGACLGGLAGKLLQAAVESTEEVAETILQIKEEIQICMFASGASCVGQLQMMTLIKD